MVKNICRRQRGAFRILLLQFDVKGNSNFLVIVSSEIETFYTVKDTFIFGDFNARTKTVCENIIYDKSDEILGIENKLDSILLCRKGPQIYRNIHRVPGWRGGGKDFSLWLFTPVIWEDGDFFRPVFWRKLTFSIQKWECTDFLGEIWNGGPVLFLITKMGGQRLFSHWLFF